MPELIPCDVVSPSLETVKFTALDRLRTARFSSMATTRFTAVLCTYESSTMAQPLSMKVFFSFLQICSGWRWRAINGFSVEEMGMKEPFYSSPHIAPRMRQSIIIILRMKTSKPHHDMNRLIHCPSPCSQYRQQLSSLQGNNEGMYADGGTYTRWKSMGMIGIYYGRPQHYTARGTKANKNTKTSSAVRGLELGAIICILFINTSPSTWDSQRRLLKSPFNCRAIAFALRETNFQSLCFR